MPATPVHALPYPAPTDPADVPYDIGNLAARLDVVIPPSSSFTPARELGYAQVTSPVTLPIASDATAQANAATLVALPAITVDAVPHDFEVYCSVLNGSASNGSRIALFQGATILGFLGWSPINGQATIFGRRRFTPTAGTYVFSARGWCNGGSAPVAQAGNGVGSNHPPMFCRLVRCQV